MIRPFTSLLFAATLCLAAQAAVHAHDPVARPVTDDVSFINPFFSDTTFLVVKIDAQRLNLPDMEKTFDTLPPEAKAAFAEGTNTIEAALGQLKELADGQPIYATAGVPVSPTRTPAFCFRRKTSADNTKAVGELLKNRWQVDVRLFDDYIVAIPPRGQMAAVSRFSDEKRSTIAAAFKAVDEYPVQLLLLPPDYVWRTVRELSPELPRQLGGGPSSVLTDGIQWASIGIDPERLRVEVIIQSSSDEAARALAAHLPKLMGAAYQAVAADFPQIPVPMAKLMLDSIKPQADALQVKIRVDGFEKNAVNFSLLAVLARAVEEKNRRHSNQQRFRQILLGMHNYHDVYKVFPPTDRHRNKDGKHGLSWRVHILPFVEHAALYEQFHLDEPWDSPHNKKLIEKMPDVFASISRDPGHDKAKPGYTTFLAPAGENTIFGGAEATKFQLITDGTSNTIALVEVTPEKAVPWTAPSDFAFDPKDPLAGIMIGTDEKWLCAFADGSVHHLSGKLPSKSVLHLFQMNDGNPVTLE